MNSKAQEPQKRDRDKTTRAILTTAKKLFSERGYDAVSLSLISKEAGVTKSLLHHYFGDKQGLWSAVKSSIVASYAEQQRVLFSANPDQPVEGVASSLATYFRFLEKQPEVASMFALESFENDYKPSSTEQELQEKGLSFIGDLQERCVLRDDIDADMILALFSALTEHWFISRERVAKLNKLKTGAALDARYFEAMSKVFKDGFKIE